MAATVTRVIVHDPEVRRLLRAEGRYGGVRIDLENRGQRVLAQAQAQAPYDTGTYQASLELGSDTTDTARVTVGSDVDYAMYVEADTGNLARALDAAGGV